MNVNPALQKTLAYGPTRAALRSSLAEADEATQTLLLQTAVLREFDSGLLARLDPRPQKGLDPADEVALYVPVTQARAGSFNYDELTRQALLDLAVEQHREESLIEACRTAAAYFEEQARQTDDPALKQRYQDQVLYYWLLADAGQGYARWQEAWRTLPKDLKEYERRAGLIQLAEQVWSQLVQAPGAQVDVLIRKGWLAYDLDDWQTAADTFWRVLRGDRVLELNRRLYLSIAQTGELMDGRRDRVLEAEVNVGLGYTQFRLGVFGDAARHFEKATWLADRRLARARPEAAHVRARALIGLGEACAEMGAPEGVLLRRLLLPAGERRLTLREYEALDETPPLEDMALERLLREAHRFLSQSLIFLDDGEQGRSHRLRVQARQARVYLERGEWERAESRFKEVLELELARAGKTGDDVSPAALRDDPRLANRLAWIHLFLGDCRLLAGELGRQEGDETAGDDDPETEARGYYRAAWSLWKEASRRADQALALRRQADLEALRLEEPARREQALRLYRTSLELYEQTGNAGQIALAQERIELLRDRARDLAGQEPDTATREALYQSVVAQSVEPAAMKRRPGKADASLLDFQVAAEQALAGRRRFFRYRFARRLAAWLKRTYRLLTGLIGFLLGAALLYRGSIPGLAEISARLTGVSWALPGLVNAFLVFLAISVADRSTRLRRLAVRVIPRRLFWLGQDQVAADDLGLHLYDDRDRRHALVQWKDVAAVRSQEWSRPWERQGPPGRQTAVYGRDGTAIHFDHELRGYQRLLEYVRLYLQKADNLAAWREPATATVHGRTLPLALGTLLMGLVLACPLTLLLVAVPALEPYGRVAFGLVAGFVGLFLLVMLMFTAREWRYMHPRLRPSEPAPLGQPGPPAGKAQR